MLSVEGVNRAEGERGATDSVPILYLSSETILLRSELFDGILSNSESDLPSYSSLYSLAELRLSDLLRVGARSIGPGLKANGESPITVL